MDEKKKNSLSNRAGLTLIELAIVVAIMAIISIVAFLGLTGYRGDQNLKLSMAEFITVMRDVQKRSITQEEGSQWGVKLTNAKNGDSYYEVFKGANYNADAVDKFYVLRRGVKFSEPYASSTYQVVFAPLSGNLAKNKIISLLGGERGEGVGDMILNTLGLVFSKIEKGVIGYWHFDEGAGNLVHDASVSNLTGTIYENGSPCNPCNKWRTGADCKAGGCLDFQGYDQNYISGDLSDRPITLSAFTIEAWVKLNANQNKAGILTTYYASNEDNISGRFKSSSREPSFYTKGDGDESGNTVEAGSLLKRTRWWYHLAFVYDGQYKKIYIDGAEKKRRLEPNKEFTIYFFDIGRSEMDNYRVLDGSLDEVKFYKRALSGSEILDHYNDFK